MSSDTLPAGNDAASTKPRPSPKALLALLPYVKRYKGRVLAAFGR